MSDLLPAICRGCRAPRQGAGPERFGRGVPRARTLWGQLVFAVALAAGLSMPAASCAQPVPAVQGGYTFPQKIGIAQLVNVEDFESKQPGLGQVGQYTFQGWRMSLYVYDKRRADIPVAPAAEQIKAELDVAAGDIHEAMRLGHYTRLEEGTPFQMPPLAKPPLFHCRSFILQATARPGDRPSQSYESYLCVTTLRRKFIKLRISSTTPPGDQATVFAPVAAAIEMTARMLLK